MKRLLGLHKILVFFGVTMFSIFSLGIQGQVYANITHTLPVGKISPVMTPILSFAEIFKYVLDRGLNDGLMVSDRRNSVYTGMPMDFSKDELNVVMKATATVVRNYHKYWKTKTPIETVFSPDQNMGMSLKHFAEVILDGHENVPGLKEKFADPVQLTLALTSLIAQESGFKANSVEWVVVKDKRGQKQRVQRAQGLLQFDKPSYWNELLSKTKKADLSWSFKKARFDAEKNLYMGMIRIAKYMEDDSEFDQIKKVHGPGHWPGDEAVLTGLYYLNHNRGRDFSVQNKAKVIYKLFSKNQGLPLYYDPIFVSTRKVLMYSGFLEVNPKGKVVKINNNPILKYASHKTEETKADMLVAKKAVTDDCLSVPCMETQSLTQKLVKQTKKITIAPIAAVNMQHLFDLPSFLGMNASAKDKAKPSEYAQKAVSFLQ